MTAEQLLEQIRQTPMARGGTLTHAKQQLCDHITTAIAQADVYPRLASRIARQLVIKCDEADLAAPSTWAELAAVLHRDVVRLQEDLGLVPRQIIVALP